VSVGAGVGMGVEELIAVGVGVEGMAGVGCGSQASNKKGNNTGNTIRNGFMVFNGTSCANEPITDHSIGKHQTIIKNKASGERDLK
jgi:hypothetical protein